MKIFALEPVLTPCGRSIPLWQFDLTAEISTEESSCLSELEWQRARRFVFERDRRRFIAAHTALRQVLGNYLQVAPSELAFAEGPHGKPSLINRTSPQKTCRFNLSHSADVAWMGISDDLEIGVDVEVPRPVSDAIALARRNYTPAELAEVESASDQNRAFFTCWTRKEACLKAIGSGFSVLPESFECGALPDARELQISQQRVAVRSLISVDDRCIGAVAWILN